MASIMPRQGPIDTCRVPVAHLLLLLEKAESVGLSSTRLLRQCRLSYSLDDLRAHRISHVPIADFTRLRQTCIIEIRERIAPPDYAGQSRADFDFMCHSLITSITLHEMLERVTRFFEIGRRRDGWFLLSIEEGRACFEIHLGPVEQQWEMFFTLNAFFVFSRLMEWMTGESLDFSFETSCPETRENEMMAEMFGTQLRFDAAASRMIFDACLLDRPVVRSPAELRLLLRGFPSDAVVPMESSADLASRIHALYRHSLLESAPLPTVDELASRMGLAGATLRRQLKAEGTSVRILKDQLRRTLAYERLDAARDPIRSVANAVGFSGAKAFSRAFRGWSGMTPARYRSASATAEQ